MLPLVVRHLSALVALSGCQVVFGIDPVEAPPKLACGPYAKPLEVAFDASLAGAHDLSVLDDEMHGAVVVDADNLSKTVPVVLDGAGTWIPDASVTATGLDTLRGHRIAPDRVLATDTSKGNTQIDVYANTGTLWAAMTPVVDGDTSFELYAGNERDVISSGATTYRRVTMVKRRTTTSHSQVVVTNFDIAVDSTSFHEDPSRTALLNSVADIQPTHAEMTDDRRTIVYAATAIGEQPDLFVTTFDDTQQAWPPGERISTLNTTGAEDEPWINADCSRIWFRRDGVVYQAQAQ
jgi:hypothetical protein